MPSALLWVLFNAAVLAFLALDLGVFNRRPHIVPFKEAAAWCALWIGLSLAFNVFVYFWRGPEPGLQFLTGYVLEYSLSMDNVFVFAVIFGATGVAPQFQHRVLFWGIMGALFLRGGMIAFGARLIAEFHWVLYLFAVFLIVTAIRMLFMDTEHSDPTKNVVVRFTRRLFPVTARFHGEHFIVRAGTRQSYESEVPGAPTLPDAVVEKARPRQLLLTPLALALVMVETTDIVFAIDSIPAIFAITTDPFLVFTSNVFAILGLRSLYFALAGMMGKFRFLKAALAFVLMVVGVKMLLAGWLKNVLGAYFNLYLLVVVLAILSAGVLASIVTEGQEGISRKGNGP